MASGMGFASTPSIGNALDYRPKTPYYAYPSIVAAEERSDGGSCWRSTKEKAISSCDVM